MRDTKVLPKGGLVQLEADGLGKSPLRLVKAVKVVRTQFERRRHVQEICCPGAQFGSCLSRQLARPFKYGIRYPPELENPIAQIFFEVG